MNNLIKTFAPNTHGRDFVVGDLHGCIDHFERLLDKIGFEPEKDRMFSVGDLVDRGPNSMACLRLLKEPWFYAVLGNHEDMMLDAVSSNLKNGVDQWIMNGGDWGVEQFEDGNPEFFELVDLVDELPITILVQTKELGTIGISHAEPPTEWTEECIERELMHLIWSRKKIDAPDGSLIKSDVDFSVHGHTIGERITVRDEIKAFWIDLGCYVNDRLCILQISGGNITWPKEFLWYGAE